jgi:hypothetical protein
MIKQIMQWVVLTEKENAVAFRKVEQVITRIPPNVSDYWYIKKCGSVLKWKSKMQADSGFMTWMNVSMSLLFYTGSFKF